MGGGGEAADRRRDISGRRIGGPSSASARSERRPGISVAQAVPPRVAGCGNTEVVSLLPVRVTEGLAEEATRSSGDQRCQSALGMIQVELPKGQVRITGRVDSEMLRTVLEKLLG
jgi:hypothetical protein